MHRFFIEPQTLTEDRTVWVGNPDDIRFRHLVDSFRDKIRTHQWKLIDLSIRLYVKVEYWDGQDVLVEDLDTKSDYYMASAYLKAGLLEKQPIIVFAQDAIPWERLKPFRAVNPQRSTRHKDGAGGHNEETATIRRRKAIEEGTTSLVSAQPDRRSGDPVTVAGGCLVRPKQYQAGLSAKEPSSLCPTLAVRLEDILHGEGDPPGSTERSGLRPR